MHLQVNEINIDYSNCEFTPAQNDPSSLTFTNLSSSAYIYKLSVIDSHMHVEPPQYAFLNRMGAQDLAASEMQQCIVRFDVPTEIKAPVMLYYKLTNFNQNHRRYVKSVSLDQLLGKKPSDTSLSNDCKPLDKINNTVVYPCGMIANSMFSGAWSQSRLYLRSGVMFTLFQCRIYTDTFSNLTSLGTDSNTTYLWSEKNIAWPGEKRKYVTKPGYNVSEIVPPPFWHDRFPNGYTDDNLPDLKTDEHFQNWMRIAGLPTFAKLWGRNDSMALAPGRYQMTINLSECLLSVQRCSGAVAEVGASLSIDFPVTEYKGTKSIVISSAAWMGGKNPFLGWAYVGGSGLLLLLGFVVAVINCIKPRFIFREAYSML